MLKINLKWQEYVASALNTLDIYKKFYANVVYRIVLCKKMFIGLK